MVLLAQKSLAELLMAKGWLSEEQLRQALVLQKESGSRLEDVLLRMGMVPEESLSLALAAQQKDVDFDHIRDVVPQPQALACLPVKFANYFKVLPLTFANGLLGVAAADPSDVESVDAVAVAAGCRVRAFMAPEKEVLEGIRIHYGLGADAVDRMMTGHKAPQDNHLSVEAIDADGSEASISRFFNQMLLQAYHDRASDIHIESFENEVRIRYRIDGVLRDANAPENLRHFRDVLISRIKVMANLNIAEKRLPQDGRIYVEADGRKMDLRVSFLPSLSGENVVIRILSAVRLYSLQELGFDGQELSWLKNSLERPHGIIFVTGPTGSGKTTTLYACLSAVNSQDAKIITVEDPVEAQIRGITQVQINPAIGLTFAATLRSMLRHDPDMLMVGEVRDQETARIAIQSALTGHLVFSTLHTNDAPSGITRLIDMEVEPFLIASAVQTIIAQRLVRRLCPHCRQAVAVSPQVIRQFALGQEESGKEIYEARGCKACRMSGYEGRLAIAEFLVLDEELRGLIVQRASSVEIRRAAQKAGMKSLLASGWEKVRSGQTSAREVLRVIQ